MAEYFDIRTPDGKITGEVKERSLVHRDGDLHGTVHIWLWRMKAGRIQLLLQLRAPDKDSYPGCYDISSAGHLVAGTDYPEGAKRELFEELGVDAGENLTLIGWQTECDDTEFYGKPFRNHEINALYLHHCEQDEDSFVLQPSEVSAVRWMDADEILAGIKDGSLKHCLRADEVSRVIGAIQQQNS